MNSQTDLYKSLWNKYIGNPDEFSMENQAFNFVSLISFFLLIICLALEIYISPTIMTYVIVVLLFIQAGVYYFSRYKKKYRSVNIIYAICSYLALIINFYENEGINGPTFFFFFITLSFLIAFSKSKQHYLWISLHLLIAMGLLLSEYWLPEWIPITYANRSNKFIDIGWSYVIALTFMFFVTHFLRQHFNNERTLSEKRAEEISEQNKQILAQNYLLEKVNEEKNKLFSIVSHDIKSPLDAITGYLEILSLNTLSNNEKAEIEALLLEQTRYTSDLLINLLSWAKAQMHGITVHLVSLHLKGMIEDVTNNKISLAARKGIKLTHSIDPSIEVIGDKEMLHIVFRNLVNNAIKFTQPGGEIFIRVYKKGLEAEISIQDTGIGISAEQQEDIFTLRTRSTYGTNNEKGIGLGLIMCKQFMEYQHGTIRFESQAGMGSVFYLSLPLTKA